jgi:hypothetical protein
MKKSLKELAKESGLETALTDSVENSLQLPRGFKSVENDKVTIDLNFLRGMNIFFATPCYTAHISISHKHVEIYMNHT